MRVRSSGSITLQFTLVYEPSPADRAAAVAGLQSLTKHGALQHTVGLRVPLAEIALAHEAVESGTVMGDVVVDAA